MRSEATVRELRNFRAAERWLIARLRIALDRVDDFVHSWEVAIRSAGE